jgi:hypothetical protein
MTSAELRAEWQRVTDSPVPRVSPSLLRLALAWEIQAKAYGRLPRDVRRTLDQFATGKTRTRPHRPGMRLVREWNGTVHVVMISDDRTIHWNDRQWGSLSEVAREITGTRWSGPAFFGLKQKLAA